MHTGCKQYLQHILRSSFIACRHNNPRNNAQDVYCIDHDRRFFSNSKSTRYKLKTGHMAAHKDYSEVTFDTAPRKEKILIVGLGNYDRLNTRHSVGMQMVKTLASKLDLEWKREVKHYGGYLASSHVSAFTQIYLLNPSEPMNLNGKSVLKAVRNLKIAKRNVFLIQDDLDRPLGKVTVKEKGSASGHNGVKSVAGSLQTDEIPRIKIGIGRPLSKDYIVDYVMKKFDYDEIEEVDFSIKEAIEKLVELLFQRNIELGNLLQFYVPVEITAPQQTHRKKKPRKKLKTDEEYVNEVNMKLEHIVDEPVLNGSNENKGGHSDQNLVQMDSMLKENDSVTLHEEPVRESLKGDNSDSECVDR